MTEWQPIESAPKDRPILVWGPPEDDSPKQIRAQCVVAFWCACLSEWHLADADEEPTWIGITHWMPLPDPPTKE